MRKFENYSSESVVGLIGIRLDDKLFDKVGFDLESSKLFVRIKGKDFLLHCQELKEAPDYINKGRVIDYL